MLPELCIFGAEHCLHVTSSHATSALVYFAAMGYTITTSVHRSRNLHEHGHDTYLVPARRLRWFPTLLTGAFACRSAWFILVDVHAFENLAGKDTYVHWYIHNPVFNMDLNLFPLGVALWEHLATLLYVSAFTILLQFWDDMCDVTAASFHATRWQRQHTSRSSYVVMINVWMYLAEFFLLSIETLWSSANVKVLNDVRDMFESLFFFALACLLIRSAFRLRRDLVAFEMSPLAHRLGDRIWFVGWFCGIWFVFKSWIGLYLVAFPTQPVDPWILYTMPEVVPALVVLLTMRVQPPLAAADERKPLLPHHIQSRAPPFGTTTLSI
ncbi:Aste57867_25305 [Aphanomyces stellatus]|uniref:Aste57867_25305 protein n=1 Tax=Aphanomyces stellatus TaxID=120398 RepID=A0A485LU48_9STRA|nr:hypothetical protein As57867_025227 [Aphanomyces stellatus]VFU01930.1 Aste57867_25305 [Aphanomyces stellatus]